MNVLNVANVEDADSVFFNQLLLPAVIVDSYLLIRMDGFDDEEIARAIALSLQETSQVPAKSKAVEVIEIQDDSDDEVSPSHSKAATEVEVSGMRPSTRTSCAKSTSSSTREVPLTRPGGAFLFDRAQLERERLARQKRLRPDIVHNRGNEDEEDEEVEEQPNAKRQRFSPSLTSAQRANMPSSSTRSVASTSVNTNLIAQSGSAAGRSESLFWEGELRQTANKHVDLDKDVRPVFRLTEILAPRDEIMFAIVSAYVINFPWLYALFNPRTPVIAVTHDPQGNETIKEVLPEWIKTTPFLRGGRGCMHMKFMLLFYKSGRLRIVVSTANLLEIDWRDIENSVWVQDVSLRSTPIPHDSKAADFPSAFTRVLRAVNVAPALLTLSKNGHENLPLRRLEDLRSKWDFSKLKAQLVPSLAGKHEGWHQVLQTGHTALMKAVRDLRVRTTKGNELVLECQGSSIGTYTTQWTNEFYCSARGDSAEQWLDKSRASRSKLDYPSLKILFPSGRTVRESVLGEPVRILLFSFGRTPN
ncbi:hypothetical protein EW026_g4163 [Hermanssonia centrifuga]|uniref:Tyrosyl-DNA phosphodiesterase n=1 Tax=Hermanssonia centrifuga TaxID=98765 RepID=A0A4S4KJT2_9APHY|nr:hypothetical protein EW026_g4163 [Hermanssonia centrifuga]